MNSQLTPVPIILPTNVDYGAGRTDKYTGAERLYVLDDAVFVCYPTDDVEKGVA